MGGATYTITAVDDVVTLDGVIRYHAGEVVDTVTTGPDGKAVSKELYLGKFEILETQAPDGMVLNKEPQQVELVYAGQMVSVTETSTGFYNERQHVSISLENSWKRTNCSASVTMEKPLMSPSVCMRQKP